MFDDDERAFAMEARDGPAPALAGVEVDARLDGPLLAVTLTQRWHHPGGVADGQALEVVYTFALPAQAVLLALEADFGGHRVEATVLPREQAEARYELGQDEGDAPVLLQALGDGLHTASLGRLAPGETVALTLRFAQFVAFEQGRLRVALPTTLAPRHGNPESAGLQGPAVPAASMAARYPLKLALTVAGSLARGAVECPSHRHQRSAAGGPLRVELHPQATMDRDVVFVISPPAGASPAGLRADGQTAMLAVASDGDGHVALAAVQLPAGRRRGPLALRLLLDASGSVAGDGIDSARRALLGVLGGLEADDEVAFSRFGHRVVHEVMPAPLSGATRGRLREAVAAAQSDLGGTRMAEALLEVMALPAADGRALDVLLLTDGEVWNTDALVEAARRSDHRVFVIGVGSAPAEGTLRRLAEASGGACEFATPGEALEAAALRMLRRMRHHPWRDLRIDWGRAPLWQAPLPESVCAGDTLLALAGFEGAAAPAAEADAAPTVLYGNDGEAPSQAGAEPPTATRFVARLVPVGSVPGDALPRLAAQRRLRALPPHRARELALHYRLLTEHTAAVLVRRRNGDASAAGSGAAFPLTVAVPHMPAAGWSGMGSVANSHPWPVAAPGPRAGGGVSRVEEPPREREQSTRAHPAAVTQQPRDAADRAGAAATAAAAVAAPGAPARAAAAGAAAWPAGQGRPSLRALLHRVQQHLAAAEPLPDLARAMDGLPLDGRLERALAVVAAYAGDRSTAWLLLALWVAERPGSEGDRPAATLLTALRPAMEPAALEAVRDALERLLGGCASDGWD